MRITWYPDVFIATMTDFAHSNCSHEQRSQKKTLPITSASQLDLQQHREGAQHQHVGSARQAIGRRGHRNQRVVGGQIVAANMVAEQALLRVVAQAAMLRLAAAHDQTLRATREAARVRTGARDAVLAELLHGARGIQVAVALDARTARGRQQHIAIAHVLRQTDLAELTVCVGAQVAGRVVNVARLAEAAVADDLRAVHHSRDADCVQAVSRGSRAWAGFEAARMVHAVQIVFGVADNASQLCCTEMIGRDCIY